MWGFGTGVVNVVLDCLVALQQECGPPLLSTRSPEFVPLTVNAFPETSG